eukprot:jgi/Picsp_1/5472/NSC_02831-R1_protein
MGKKSLFDENEAVEDTKLNINESFAKRFEHNKKREELHRLKEKYPEVAARLDAKGVSALEDSDVSSSEEEDDGYISSKKERQILETILKIRKKDKSIYDPQATFYSDDGEEEEKRKDGTQNEKPMYLKDMVYKEAIELAQGRGDEGDLENSVQGKTYVEEQDDLKKAFLDAFDNEVVGNIESKEDGFGGVLSKSGRKRKEADISDEETERLVGEIFSKERGTGQESKEDEFLKNYILKKAWINEDEEDSEFEDGNMEEDEEAFDAAEAFEAGYNFRFEEPGGSSIVTHARQIDDVVRKSDDRRKLKRAEKAARKAQEEEERRLELKQLKNLKKAEIEKKLEEVKTVAGLGAPDQNILGQLLDGEFDPEAHDKAMAAAFGEDYYDQGDDEEYLEDEDFDRKLAEMAEYSSDENEETFASLVEKTKRIKDENGHEADAAKQDMKKLMEEYFKLDYEDYVGGVRTRFKYKQVQPETYGLTFEEILSLDDKELNQIIGMKKVAAPYHDGPRLRPNYGKLNEMRKQKGSSRRADGGQRASECITKEQTVELEDMETNQEEKEKMRRLQTFKKPSLKKKSQSEEKTPKKRKASEERDLENGQESKLTRAQKRNRRRSLKRAAKDSQKSEIV